MELPQLIMHLSENAPGFAARLQAASIQPEDIRSTGDLNAIPIIRKDDLVDLQKANPPFGGYLSCSPSELKRIFQSPGPIYDPEARRPDYWRWAPALLAAGFHPGDIVFNAFSYHLTPAGAMFEEGLWAVGCSVIPGGVGNQEQQVAVMHCLKANGYLGLPSYLKALMDKAADLNLELGVKKAFCTAEPLPPSLRRWFNERGIIARQGYATAECGNLGYECEMEDGWHIPEDAIIQVCDLSNGQPLPAGQVGEIVVTLFMPEYALVRFGTGDLSSLNLEPCKCGRISARLMGWQGRVGDAVKVRGLFLHPRQLAELMKRFPEVAGWQAVITRQEHKDFLTLRVVPGEQGAAEDLTERIAAAARDAIKLHPTVEIASSETLPPGSPPVQDTRSWD